MCPSAYHKDAPTLLIERYCIVNDSFINSAYQLFHKEEYFLLLPGVSLQYMCLCQYSSTLDTTEFRGQNIQEPLIHNTTKLFSDSLVYNLGHKA